MSERLNGSPEGSEPMPRIPETLRGQWIADLEQVTAQGERAQRHWWDGLEGDQRAYYLELAHRIRTAYGGTPAERMPAPNGAPVQAAAGEGLSPAAAQLLLRCGLTALAAADADWDAWDRQIEADAESGRLGRLDALAAKARGEHKGGRSTPL